MRVFYQLFMAAIALFLFAIKANATHIFGADLYYTYISGSTYKITLTVYGDCSGSAFNNLYSAVPQIEVYNNTTLYQTISLNTISSGIEVTPVCALQINNTTCNGGTVPGVKQFIFSGNVTLNTTSSNWRFRFNGSFGGQNQAGRSTTITNISVSTGSPSLMALEATLNNTSATNSAPEYTTIPTPFFCINIPAQYNPGAVDANNDSLSFSLTDGLTPTGTVTYLTGYSAASPLAVAVSSFSLSATTGQLNFTPNLVQNSLVVNKVEEYRNGTLIGTSMREMVFVVLNNCNNNPPTGTLSVAAGGSIAGNVFKICQGQGAFSFHINPTDADGNSINVSIAGLPSWLGAGITGNNTTAPSISMVGNTIGVATGSYTFYVTYQDDGCPLSSKQTVAYTVNVVANPGFQYVLSLPATCVRKAVFTITPSGTPSPYTITILQNNSTVHSFTNVTAAQTDSLNPGTYTIRVTNANGCPNDSVIVLTAPIPVGVGVTALTNPTCNASNGSITITGNAGLMPYEYAIGTGAYSSNSTFGNLIAGSHTLHVRDANGCIKDTVVSLQTLTYIAPFATVKQSTCATLNNGEVILSATNGITPYTFAVGTSAYSSSATFSGLSAGTYVFHIKDANNCIKDTTISIADSIIVTASIILTSPPCHGAANGVITINGANGTAPYTFSLGTSPYVSANSFNGIAAGSYVVHVKDSNGCIKDTSVVLSEPATVTMTSSLISPQCNGGFDGSITIVASGGTMPYTYAIGSNAFAPTGNFTGLSAGTYTLHIKDNNGCIKDSSVILTQPQPITTTCITADATCYGTSTGSVIVNAAGGTAPFSYSADNGVFQNVNLISGLSPGSHIIQVRDSHGCTKDTVITIGQPTRLSIDSFVVISPTCEGYADGGITIQATGGITPYQYAVGSGSFSSSASFSQLIAGTYDFIVRDNNGCVASDSVTLIGYPVINIDSATIYSVSCYGSQDGRVILYTSGGVPDLSYTMGTIAAIGNMFSGLSTGNYTVTVTDSKGCKKDTIVYIPTPDPLSVIIDTTNNDCEGLDDNGVLEAIVSGGTYPYSYAWSAPNTPDTSKIIGLPNGTYKVIITDANNCKDSTLAEIVYDCCNIFIPNAFTPNHDGRNDQFRISYKGNLKLLQMLVYNRFGQLVYSSYNHIENGWDGTFNGIPQDLGTYFYYIKVLCGEVNPKEKVFKGDVILVR